VTGQTPPIVCVTMIGPPIPSDVIGVIPPEVALIVMPGAEYVGTLGGVRIGSTTPGSLQICRGEYSKIGLGELAITIVPVAW
jgi:hypothetical protein